MNPDVAAKKAKLAELRAKNLSRHVDARAPPRSPSRMWAKESTEVPSTQFTSAQKAEILASSKFHTFLDRSSKVIEKALSSDTDILHDYGINSEEETASNALVESSSGNCLSALRTRCHREVESRPVMSIKANNSRPELVLCAYGGKTSVPSNSVDHTDAPPGVVCVWSDLLLARPEFTFYAPSPVLTADFNSIQPNLVVGACKSGQILLWDLRSKSKVAVKRSNPCADGCHTCPVHGLRMVGNAECSHTVISCDTDGGLCTWRVGLNDLSVPSQRWKMQLNTLTSPPFSTGVLQGTFLPLSHSSAPANTLFRSAPSPTVGAGLLTGGGDYVPSLGLTCISHSSAHRDYARSLFFGTSHGHLCRANLPIRDNDDFVCIPAHPSYLSSVECHPSTKNTFRNLLLTSSFDWTVKLWTWDETSGSTAATAGRGEVSSAPLLLQEIRSSTCDYVADTKWSPTHSALFACAHAGGTVALWDLSRGTSEPVGTILCLAGARARTGTTLNALEWSSDGRRLFCGDSAGDLYELSLQKEAAPLEDDERRAEANVLAWRERPRKEQKHRIFSK